MPPSAQSSSAGPRSSSLDSAFDRLTISTSTATSTSIQTTDASSISDKYTVLPPTAASRDRSSLPAELAGSNHLTDFLTRGRGDRDAAMATPHSLSRQRSQYYDDPFHRKDSLASAVRERVQRESPILAELRTNVIVKDEFTLVTDLSYHLAARYTRPDSAVMVKIDHSACLALGGTFEPCYIITITAVPSQMGPTMNKRNAALIQSFLADILGVAPERGIIKFQPIPDENLAINGTTILGEVERQEKRYSGEHMRGMRSALARRSMPTFKRSLPRLDAETKTPTEVMKSLIAESTPIPIRADSAAPSHDSEAKSDATPTQLSATITSPTEVVEVYELPATELNKERPVSIHKRKSSGASNGLRMNPVSSGTLSPTRNTPPNRAKKPRPRTFSGENYSVRDKLKGRSSGGAANPPPISRYPTKVPAALQPMTSKTHSFLKHDPSNTAAKASLSNTSRPTTPRQRSSTTLPRKDNDSATSPDGRQAALKALSGTWTNETAQEKSRRKIERLTGEKSESFNKKDTEANTAKRRSTITATPKYPAPPPIPTDKQDAKSLSKVGKRKSFLSAFRRHAPAQTAAH